MIDLLTHEELRELAEARSPASVSLYLPTHRRGSEVQQDHIRLKNLLGEAAAQLDSLGVRRDEVESLLAPATALVEDADFWAHGDLGLAVLLDRAGMRTFRMGEATEELAVVSQRFHVKPLLRSLASGDSFWIVAVSQNRVRLLRGGRNGASELALGEIPQSLAEALWFEDRERQLQSHGASRVGAGRVAATFHGQGLGKDTQHSDLARFLRAVDNGVRQITAESTDPVLLAGVERDLTAYREVSRCDRLLEASVSGNCDRMSVHELHDAAWPLLQERFEAELQDVIDAAGAETDPASREIEALHAAALEGRVSSLLVALGVQVWGGIGDGGAPVVHEDQEPGDRDLLDAVAIETMTHGGSVHAVEAERVPGGAALAGVLRW